MSPGFESRVEGQVDAEQVTLGQGVVIEEGAFIGGKNGPAQEVVLGDHCFIGRGTRILVPSFRMGDYSKLHANSFLHGELPLGIGRNCWIGGNVVLDSMGGLDIDDNVGIGAHSQLWTHVQFGDVVEGSRFFSQRYMHVQKDAWFVGHCLVSPVNVGERSMALLGSVIVHDMIPNHVYAGVPATDVTDRVGPQFEERTTDRKAAILRELIRKWAEQEPGLAEQLVVVTDSRDRRPETSWFDVSTRTYNKRLAEAEVAFLKAHTPLVKFVPEGERPFTRSRALEGTDWNPALSDRGELSP